MSEIQEQIQSLLTERGLMVGDPAARELIRLETNADESHLEEFFGHGPLLSCLQDESVTEIVVNGPFEIWLERAGNLRMSQLRFSSEESLRRYVRRLLASQGRKVDQRAPFADAVIDGGIRLHVAVPPVSRRGICLSLRKPPKEPWSLDRLRSTGSFNESITSQLRAYLKHRKNIFVCGGTGSGKTSFLGALIGEISAFERVIALEDVAEIRANHPHFLSLEARPANQEGEGELNLTRLLRESLRMRPDRLVVGECRGPEALDVLMALNTGHSGSLATIHANSPRDALHRLESLALLAGKNLTETVVKALVASSVHVVIFLDRFDSGRRVASIAEVRGVESGNYLLREFKFHSPS